MSGALEVWLDVDFLEGMHKVGMLSHDRGQVRFRYDSSWLNHPACFMLDPDLSLDAAPFFPNPTAGNDAEFDDPFESAQRHREKRRGVGDTGRDDARPS